MSDNWSRFTEQSKLVLAQAQKLAEDRGNMIEGRVVVTAEHLLWALLETKETDAFALLINKDIEYLLKISWWQNRENQHSIGSC